MSGSVPDNAFSVSSSGYTDGLGRRLLEIDHETGDMLERLVLRPELSAFEQQLRDRVARLPKMQDERFSRPRRIARDEEQRLTVLSEYVAGRRLADAIDTAASAGVVAGLDAGLGLLLELLPAVGYLHGFASFAHGCLAPGRVVATPAGQLIVLDWIYGAAVERLQFTRQRLWTEFGVAPPPTAGSARLDVSSDLTQAAMIAAALTIGRPLGDRDYPAGVSALRTEILEVAQIRGTKAFAAGVEQFFDRLLPTAARRSFSSADEAVLELRQLVRREIGIDSCRTAWNEFLHQVDVAEAEHATETPRTPGARVEAERRVPEENERLARERAARQQADRERKEQERLEAERLEWERLERDRRERDRREAERREQERLEAERRERERIEAERREQERIDAVHREQERLEAERREKERIEAERRERERLEAERRAREEEERLARERAERERQEKERLERVERERVEAERREQERLEAGQREKERLEAERREKERIEAERREREHLEAERRAREEAERIARERAERERMEKERLERERLEKERLERVERERVEAERREQERLEAGQREKERLEAERREKERIEAERRERDRLEAERRAREEAERIARDRAERERMEQERAERERLEKERLERERREKARLEAERRENELIEAERRDHERLEAKRKERERAEAARREEEARRVREDKQRLERERQERDRVTREQAAKERLERERAEAAVREQEERQQAAKQSDAAGEPAGSQARDGGSSRRRKREKSARARKDKLRSVAPAAPGTPVAPPAPPPTAIAAQPAAPAPKSWLVPPERAAAFEPPVPLTLPASQLPAPPPPPPPPPPVRPPAAAAPRTYPVYVPPADGGGWAAPLVPPVTPDRGAPGMFSPASAPIRLKSDRAPFREGAVKAPEPVLGPPSITLRNPSIRPQAPPPIEEPALWTAGMAEREPLRRIPWTLVAAAVVVLVTGAAAYQFWERKSADPHATAAPPATARPEPAPSPPTAPVPTGQLTVTTQPPGAKVLLDGKAVGTSPVTLKDLTPGKHTVTLMADAGAVRRTVRIEAGGTATLEVPIFSGFVEISAPIVLQVSEGGRSLGTSENQIMLAPGHHELRLANQDLNYVVTQGVDVEPGEGARLQIEAKGVANINAQPWAEVWIDGVKAGETPLANLPITLGVREIVFRNPQFPERKIATTIVSGTPTTITIDLTRQ